MRVASLSRWESPAVVAGFSLSPPNVRLLEYARRRRRPWTATRVLDIGCGAGRNAVPLSTNGFEVIGVDLSRPMLSAARCDTGRLQYVEAGMDQLPICDRSIDLIIAHGIWNLAESGRELRSAIAEAGRVAAVGAGLFVFTFSRNTLPRESTPVDGESFIFTQFSGVPQAFLTHDQLLHETGRVGFVADPDCPLRELNLPPGGAARLAGPPVIYEAGFRFIGD